jgi:SAM-dependent methyltransferase
MFDEIAKYYDNFKLYRNYEIEADILDDIISKTGEISVRSLVELGCGTGNLISKLNTKGYNIDGIDSSNSMLDIAKSKNIDPSGLVNTDFTSYVPKNKYDGVIWIDGAIGYVNPNRMTETISNIANNILARSGVLIIEPWYSEANWRPNTSHLITYESDNGDKFIRLSHGRKDGSIEFHHLIATQHGIEHILGFTKFWLHDYSNICNELSDHMNVRLEDSSDTFSRGLIVGSR